MIKNTKGIQLSRTILLCGRTITKYLPLPATTVKKKEKQCQCAPRAMRNLKQINKLKNNLDRSRIYILSG